MESRFRLDLGNERIGDRVVASHCPKLAFQSAYLTAIMEISIASTQ